LLIFYFVGIILLTIIDQLSKWLVCRYIPEQGSITIWKGIFSLTHIKNPGAGMGLLAGQLWLLVPIAALVIIGVTVYMIKKKPSSFLLITSLTLVVSGALGNLIDRIFLGEVVDFLNFSGLYFPYIFNLADCFVVCGAFLLAFYIIFVEGKEKKSKETEEGKE